MLVDLGGGTLPHPRAEVVIDLHHPKNAPSQNAAETPWRCFGKANVFPRTSVGIEYHLGDECADEVYASHFMEHIHRGVPLISVMNEAWRILKPGGSFLMILPLVGYTSPHDGSPQSNQIGWQPWADPTHVNYWWFPEALMYFCEGPFKPHANYGIETWAPLGEWIPEETATKIVADHHKGQINPRSFWSVRSEWEGVALLKKP